MSVVSIQEISWWICTKTKWLLNSIRFLVFAKIFYSKQLRRELRCQQILVFSFFINKSRDKPRFSGAAEAEYHSFRKIYNEWINVPTLFEQIRQLRDKEISNCWIRSSQQIYRSIKNWNRNKTENENELRSNWINEN